MNFKPENGLMARYLSGECTDEEKNRIEEWLRLSPDNQEKMEIMKDAWLSSKRQTYDWDTQQLWTRIVNETGIQREHTARIRTIPFAARVLNSRILRVAAVFIMAVSVLYFFNEVKNSFRNGQWRDWHR